MNVSEVSPGQQAGQGQWWPPEARQVASGGSAFISEGFISDKLSGLIAPCELRSCPTSDDTPIGRGFRGRGGRRVFGEGFSPIIPSHWVMPAFHCLGRLLE